jgi:hypothetical protein
MRTPEYVILILNKLQKEIVVTETELMYAVGHDWRSVYRIKKAMMILRRSGFDVRKKELPCGQKNFIHRNPCTTSKESHGHTIIFLGKAPDKKLVEGFCVRKASQPSSLCPKGLERKR